MGYAMPWTARDPDARIMLKLSCTRPSAFTLYFTDRPISDATIIADGASVGMATAFKVQAFEFSNTAWPSLTLALRNIRYTPNAPAVPAAVSAAGSLAELLCNNLLHGAAASITQYCYSPGKSDSETLLADSWSDGGQTLYNGIVWGVTNITAQDVTLIIRGGGSVPWTEIPPKIVGAPVLGFTADDVPEVSKGLAVPIRLGGRVTPPPPGWESYYTEANDYNIRQRMIVAGFPHVGLMPARIIGKQSDGKLRLAWADKPADMPAISAFQMQNPIYQRLPETDSLAWYSSLWNNSSDSQATADGYYRADISRGPRLWTLVTPKEITGVSAGVTNPGNAIDRKPNTYMKIEWGAAEEVRFRMPSFGSPGAIVPGNGGMMLRVLLAAQPPGEAAAAGSFYMGIKEPYPSTTWQFNSPPPGGGMIAISSAQNGLTDATETYESNTYYTPRYTEWRGTDWQMWDWTASRDAGDPTYVAGKEGEPFDLVISTTGACRAYIVAVMIGVAFIRDKEDYVRYETKYLKGYKGKKIWTPERRPVSSGSRRVRTYGSRTSSSDRGEVGESHWRSVWDRGVGRAAPAMAEELTDPEGFYAFHPSFKDLAGTYGGGANSWLDAPGQCINYLMRKYPSRPSGIASGSGFGQVGWFNGQVNYWAARQQGGATYKIGDCIVDSITPLDPVIEAILSECPGNASLSHGTDGKPNLVAETWEPTYDAAMMHPCVAAGGLLPQRDIAASADRPGVEIQYTGDFTTLCNDLTIEYGYDYTTRRSVGIAKVNETISDDGHARTWSDCPGSGLSASALAALSQTDFKGRHQKSIALQFIHDPAAAVGFGLSWLWYHWRPMAMLHFVGTMACHSMRPGQIITLNDAVRTKLGVNCAILYRAAQTWTNFYWIVYSVERIDGGIEGGGAAYEVFAREHLNGIVGPAAGIVGGPPMPGEGFDI